VQCGDAAVHLAVGAQLDAALYRRGRRRAAGPDRADRADLADAQGVGRADGHRVGHRLDRQHVAGLAVRSRAVQAQALALADGEAVDALVRADHRPVGVNDRTWRGAQLAGQEAAGIAVGDEAHVVAVGLVRDQQPAGVRLLPHLGLGRVAQREQRVRDLVLVEHREHVGLVLAGVDGPLQRAVGRDPRVVPGADRVEAEGERPVEDRRELDLLVAAQARVRGPARRVLGDEVVDHVAGEALGHVPHVERDADHVGGPARVAGVLDRAAAARPGPVRLRVGRQRQVDAGHLVTGVHRACRRGRGVNAAGHSGQNPKPHNNSRISGPGYSLGTPALGDPGPGPCVWRWAGYGRPNATRTQRGWWLANEDAG